MVLRLAERHKVNRKDFLDRYIDNELAEGWLESVAKLDKKWTAFATNEAAAELSGLGSPGELMETPPEELLLDQDDILTPPVSGAPIAPPADDDFGMAEDTTEQAETPKAARESGTLFERMSNIARGAAKAQGDDEETGEYRPEPIDIPRFLNRQNNQ